MVGESSGVGEGGGWEGGEEVENDSGVSRGEPSGREDGRREKRERREEENRGGGGEERQWSLLRAALSESPAAKKQIKMNVKWKRGNKKARRS